MQLDINFIYNKRVVIFFRKILSGWSFFSGLQMVGGHFLPMSTTNHITRPPPGINSDQALRERSLFIRRGGRCSNGGTKI